MPKQKDDIVYELNEQLRLAGRPCITIPFPEFYELCERERLKQPLLDGIQERAASRFQLIVAYGRNAVVVCHDRNFAPTNEPYI